MSDKYDEKAAETLTALAEVHRGWCNYCCGRAETCDLTAGKIYECSLVESRRAVAAALRELGQSRSAHWDNERDLRAKLEAAEREREELQTVIEEKSALIGSQIDEIHGLEYELEQVRGGPAKNAQWKQLVSQRNAAYIAGLEAAKEAMRDVGGRFSFEGFDEQAVEAIQALIDAKTAKP